MKNGWSPERKARQATLIRTWRPWEKSTGPRSEAGKAVASQNGRKYGEDYSNLSVITQQVDKLLREAIELRNALKAN